MSPLEQRIADVLAGPSGSSIGAFFDFDGTLIDGYSAAVYLREQMRKREMGLGEFANLLLYWLIDEPTEAEFHELVSASARKWAGLEESALAEKWKTLFYKHIAARMFPESWQLVKAHQRMGHTVVIASSATPYQIQPAADEYGIKHILATPLAVKNGVITGKLDGEPLWNQGKARAVRQFAKDHKTDLKQSYAYANGDEDIAFLSSVGRPMALNAGTQLAEVAETHQWPQTRFSVRRKMPLSAKLRTVASYSAMAGSFLGGLAANKLGVPQKQALNFITAVAPEMGLAAAGIELNIIGEENLWAERPAVFVFNHQSPLDLVIAINLMRKNATGVVKQEAADMLGWGQFLKFMDAAFVDRADPEKARAALAPAVEKLKKGMSLGICPEGTRSYSPRMGPFKKGAFHMAMQAQVPIVPVVLRNAGEVMHRNAGWMRSGVVDICVLPPISVEKWKRENLDQHIADVRQLFIDTLDQWPKHGTVKAVRRKLAA